MEHTYLEWYEPKRGDRLAHHFVDFTGKGGGNVDIVATKHNTSADWAGGGLVSTVDDLNCFIRALFSGKLFQHKATLEQMTKPHGRFAEGQEYGLGIRMNVTNRGQRTYLGHFGYWGVGMFYCPAHDVSLVYCRNQPGKCIEDLDSLDELVGQVGLIR